MRAVGFCLFASLTLAAFVLGSLHPFGNPRSVASQPARELLSDAPMPEAAKNVLKNNCADCHSEATRWPFYARVAPVSWLVEHDVIRGRQHLNLSHWDQATADRREVLAQEMVHSVRYRSMPPIQYRLVHWSATPTPSAVAALSALVPADSADSSAVRPGDPERGKAAFERKCTGCHALEVDREGPRLRGVYGRKAASVPGFKYSEALQKSGLVWGDSTIDLWLRDTDAAVPGSAMGFSVPKPQDRADIIAFLKSLH